MPRSPASRHCLAVATAMLLAPSLLVASDFKTLTLSDHDPAQKVEWPVTEAASRRAPADSVLRGTFEYKRTTRHQIAGRVHWLASESMSDAYRTCYSVWYQGTTREETRLRFANQDSVVSNAGEARGEVGLLVAAGEPILWDDDWTINSADLFLLALPVSSTYLINLVSDERDQSPRLYIGFGLGLFWGIERLSAKIENQSSIYEWHDTSFRWSFEGHALLGTARPIGDSASLVFELQWTQAGKGRLKRAELTAQQIADGWDEVFNDIQHPDFNFTGLNLSLGVRW